MTRDEAKQAGLKTYFTGAACKNNHTTERSVATGSCVECARNRAARFYDVHGTEYRTTKSTEHYQHNKQKYIERGKTWRDNNPEKVKVVRQRTNERFRNSNPEYAARWWKDNPNKASQYGKQSYAKEARRRWRETNKGHQNFLTRLRQKAVKRATPSWADLTTIKSIYIEAATRSAQEGVEYHVDHVIPLRGKLVCGLHIPANLQIITKQANLEKGVKFE